MINEAASDYEIAAYGGIAEPTLQGVRSSSCIKAQPNADATQMERASSLVQRRYDNLNSGTKVNRKLSFLSMPNEEIVARASRLWGFFGNFA